MIEMLMIALMAIVMAKHGARKGGRGKFRRYMRGNVDEVVALGTLAPRSLVAQVFDEVVQERTWISSLVASWSMTAFTPATNDGPVLVGVAYSDYSPTEIEEFIENTGSWNEASLVQTREVGKRLIRVIGTFPTASGAGVAAEIAVLNGGRKIRTKLGWMLTTGQILDLWAYNLGSSALATTDPQVFVQGHANLWPR